MLRERVTWFFFGAATMGVVAFLVMGHPGESPARAAEPITAKNGAVGIAAVTPLPARVAASKVPDEAPASPAAVSQIAQPEASVPSVVTPPEEAAPSPQQPLREGRRIVSHAIETGQWTNKDAAALAAVSGSLNPADRRELYSKLAVAFNQDRIHAAGGLLPR